MPYFCCNTVVYTYEVGSKSSRKISVLSVECVISIFFFFLCWQLCTELTGCEVATSQTGVHVFRLVVRSIVEVIFRSEKMSCIEQRTNIKFCVLLKKTPGETLEMLAAAYGEAALKKTAV